MGSNMGYTKDVVKGVSWIGSLRFLTKGVGLLETIILARILAPAQFGAYAVALLTLGVLEVITETGVNIFLLQEDNIDRYISSAWCISILRGLFISLLLFFLAPHIANFFHSPESLQLLYLMSAAPLLRGFINPSVIKFQKELQFGRDFSYRITILMIDTLVSVIVTYLLKSPIGIIIGLITGIAVEVIFSFIIASPRPRIELHTGYLSQLFHRGKWVTAAGISDYLFENVDNIAVGRMLGTGALGIYQMAYAFTVLPLSEVGKVFVHVTTPVLVKMLHDPIRVRRAYLRMVAIVGVLCLPVVLLLIIYPQITILLLGSKWTAIVSIMPVLVVLGYARAFLGTSSALFLSMKRQDYSAFRTLITIAAMLVVIVPFITSQGIVGAGYAGLTGSLISVPFTIYFIVKILRVSAPPKI
jgi:O-antigen/teichoic acid export membrane protein